MKPSLEDITTGFKTRCRICTQIVDCRWLMGGFRLVHHATPYTAECINSGAKHAEEMKVPEWTYP